jgi:hypothetical protein
MSENDPALINAETMPDGEYAIVEILGHRTMVGRISEIERFGTKLMQIEPLFCDVMLPGVLIGGASIYQFTPCTAAVRHPAHTGLDGRRRVRPTLSDRSHGRGPLPQKAPQL